jgi:transcriptional regulator with XRE-family HTH domain
LRRLREQAGLTIDQVAKYLECSESKISRIETAHVSATPRDVRDMLNIYGVDGQQLDALVQVAREARVKGWWHSYGDKVNVAIVGLEAAADSIRIYEAQLVPGLLQTVDYARAVFHATQPDLTPSDIHHRVELRMARQALLTQDDPPMLWAVLDEAVLRRTVGGRGIMREQMHRLCEASELPNITIQILPFSIGQHAGMNGSFTVVGFPEFADPDVVYLENQTSDLYLEKADEVGRYTLLFDHLRADALRPDATIDLVMELAKEQ